ncbi:hypothetical protein [Streptomyces hypolithicus]
MAAQAATPSGRPGRTDPAGTTDPPRTTEPSGTTGPARTSEPAGAAQPAGRPSWRTGPVRRHPGTIPATLGLVYGIIAAFLTREGGSLNGWDVLTGVICGLVLAGLCFLLGRAQYALIPLVRAAAYAALAGIATGFLHSLSDVSVLRSVGLGVALAAGTGITAFYVFYTRE